MFIIIAATTIVDVKCFSLLKIITLCNAIVFVNATVNSSLTNASVRAIKTYTAMIFSLVAIAVRISQYYVLAYCRGKAQTKTAQKFHICSES